jgi:hypothetical protein
VRVPFKFVGYCDESEDETSLVITCVFARAADWTVAVRPWQALLTKYGMPEFHAEHCEHRKGFWETWSDPSERLSVAHQFLDLIIANRLPFPTVYATGVDLRCFKDIAAPMIREAHPGKRLDAHWLLAFHQVLTGMLEAQRFTNNTLGTVERIDLICDDKNDFSGRVRRRVEEVKETTDHPLAGVRFAGSESAVGIQMADIIAYEMRKALSAVILNDETHGIRDQWMQLMAATMPGGQRRIYVTFWDEAAMRGGNLPPGLV